MIEGAMRSFPILAFTVLISILAGIYALPHLNKNEFPDVKVMQGVVAVVYPGATAEEIEEQVAGKVEEYLFTFTDVDKNSTYSQQERHAVCLRDAGAFRRRPQNHVVAHP